jgi:small subunit ribosomal protein S1
MTEDFAALLAEYDRHGIRPRVGDRVRATVVGVGEHAVFVDIGAGVDGVVLREDLADVHGVVSVAEGDELDLYVVACSASELRLARSLSGVAGLAALEEAFQAKVPVEGRVHAVVQGGLEVQVAGRRAFCPASQAADGYVDDLGSLVGQTLRFRITAMDSRGRNIVLSRRQLLEAERRASQEAFWAAVREGDVVDGVVTRCAAFGVFVEVAPGLEGLVHLSELSWRRGVAPEDVVAVGERVRVKYLGWSQGKKEGERRLALSLKQAAADPWDRAAQELVEGEKYPGTVSRLADFGAFVELWPGVEGLVHTSEIRLGRRIRRASDVLQVGDAVVVQVLTVDSVGRRLSLALVEAPSREGSGDAPEDWRSFASKPSQGLGSLGQVLAQAMEQKTKKIKE